MNDENRDQTIESTTADQIAAAVLAVPGVAGLHGGLFGEVATYLPGRRIAGIRLSEDRGEVHIIAHLNGSVLETAEQAQRAASAIAGYPIDVVVDDLASDDDPTSTPAGGSS